VVVGVGVLLVRCTFLQGIWRHWLAAPTNGHKPPQEVPCHGKMLPAYRIRLKTASWHGASLPGVAGLPCASAVHQLHCL